MGAFAEAAAPLARHDDQYTLDGRRGSVHHYPPAVAGGAWDTNLRKRKKRASRVAIKQSLDRLASELVEIIRGTSIRPFMKPNRDLAHQSQPALGTIRATPPRSPQPPPVL